LVASRNSEEGGEQLKKTPWSSPVTGNQIEDLWNLDSSDIYAVDIVHGLRQNRFSYHTHIPLNLLNHSVAVSEYLEERGKDEYTQLAGLLHDAHEAYTGDTVRPVKILYPEIDDLEMEVQRDIWDSFGIDEPSEELWSGAIDEGDQAVLLLEADRTMSEPEFLNEIKLYLEDHEVTPEEVMDIGEDIGVSRGREHAKKEFRDRFEQLMIDVYGPEHLDAHYDSEMMDDYQIPGGINSDLRKKGRDTLLVGADKLYHRVRNGMYRSRKSRRED
jgi:5'-deoxynucleotidase YfbR-like HD superfamily hydrolase